MAKGDLFSPEAVIMLPIAAILDLIGFILFMLSFLGVDDYGVLDTIGGIIIGGWMFIRGSTRASLSSPKKKKGATKKIVEKAAKKALKRFGLAFLVEIIPFLGGLAPGWTIAVFSELRSN